MSESSVVTVRSPGHLDELLKSYKIVVADFFTTWCAPCKHIAPIFDTLAEALSLAETVIFVKIDAEELRDTAEKYDVRILPTFITFLNGEVYQTVKGADPMELHRVVDSLVTEVEADPLYGGRPGSWFGAEIPRGYRDITGQIEFKNCELSNARDDAGPVQVLFEPGKPKVLEDGKGSIKDYVQSGADDQLLLYIPFEGSVKLHTLQITSIPAAGQDEVSRPEVIHLYINRPQIMDFDEADDSEPTQIITLKPEDWNAESTANIHLRFVKFQKTTSLVLYVQKGKDGADAVRLDRIKIIGEAGAKREMGKLQKVEGEE
ncbi:hypothetical protein E4U60_004565 [Claviceps pazoutovae]|uniref:Thioredoxin n=1 Tax=Claviceps pazoutovae TaxID=1649127 RepID=A0A9P7MHI8_9HYPO|nr:hypothetical protein E4U60_004565 [Claviceps pazoutovae]